MTIKSIGIMICLLTLLTGCAKPVITVSPPETTSIIPIETQTPFSVRKTSPINPTRTATLPALPKNTATAIRTQLPKTTLTATIVPTWTPLPTLPSKDAQALVITLLKDNAGCRLPCWWGITPGKTSWQEAKSFLETFTSIGTRVISDEVTILEPLIPFPKEMGTIRHAYFFRNGIVEEISKIYYGNLTSAYNLTEMLTNYGQPDEVMVSAYYESRYSDYMVEVAVFYLQQGFLVIYYDNDVVTVGDTIQVCPQKATYPYLSLWSPARKLTIQEAVKHFLDTMNWPPYKVLQDATKMDIKTFYQTFKDPHNAMCLEMPTHIWPKP